MTPWMRLGRSRSAPALLAASAIALVGGAVLLVQGDAPATAPEAPAAGGTASSSPTATAEPAMQPTSPVPPDVLAQPAVRAAVAMAARDAGVPEDQVLVTDAREVTWPSSALGCPEPGMMYAEVLTPGYRVMTYAAGARRVYHTDRGGSGEPRVVPCSATQSKPGSIDVPAAQLEAVRADAAARAGGPDVPVELVRTEISQATTLTCDEVAGGSDAASVTGQLVWDVVVRAGAGEHRYRVAASGFVHCGGAGVDEQGNPID